MICCPIWMSSLWKEIQILWSIFKGGRTVNIQQLKFCKVIMNFEFFYVKIRTPTSNFWMNLETGLQPGVQAV